MVGVTESGDSILYVYTIRISIHHHDREGWWLDSILLFILLFMYRYKTRTHLLMIHIYVYICIYNCDREGWLPGLILIVYTCKKQIHNYIHIYVYLCVHIYTYICIRIYIYIYVTVRGRGGYKARSYIYTCVEQINAIHVYVCTCIHIRIYIYIFI